jgi:hypothetical protein
MTGRVGLIEAIAEAGSPGETYSGTHCFTTRLSSSLFRERDRLR